MKKWWRKISNLGIDPEMKHGDRRSISLLNRITAVICLLSILYFPLGFIENILFIPVLTATLILYLLVFYFTCKRWYSFSRGYFLIISMLVIMTISIIPGEGSGERYFFIISGFLPLLLFNKRSFIVGFTLLNALCFYLTYAIQSYYPPLVDVPEEAVPVFFVVNMAVFFILVFVSVNYFKKDNQYFEKILRKTNDELSEKNKEILDSIAYARRIQDAMLPPEKSVGECLGDAFVLYLPKDIVAGDFYWVENENGKVYFTAADCTGHGVPGALVSVICSNALNKSLKELNILQPAAILDSTARLLEEQFKKSNEQVKDGMDLALCSLDRDQQKMEFAGANNPLYIIRENSKVDVESKANTKISYTEGSGGGKVLTEVKGDKQPVGKYDNRKPYTNHSIKVQKNDCIYLFSDGYVDQFGGPRNKKFKSKAFKKLLISIHDKPMDFQKEILKKTILEWKGDREQLDDICVIGLRV